MRIKTTDAYEGHTGHIDDCLLEDCQRKYCFTHRLLWRDCETVKEGMEGDRDVTGGTRTILEMGDCPSCEREYERRRFERLMARQQTAA